MTKDYEILEVKKWWQSKTIWLNVASFVTLVYALIVPGGDFSDLLTPEVLKYIGLAVAVLNVAVRVFLTEGPVEKSLT